MSSSESEPLLQSTSTQKTSKSLQKTVVTLTLSEEMPSENSPTSGQESEAAEATLKETRQTLPQVAGGSTNSFNAGFMWIMFKQVLYSEKFLKFFTSIFGLWPIKRKLQLTIISIFLALCLFAFVYYDLNIKDDKNFVIPISFLFVAWIKISRSSCFFSCLLMFHYSLVSSRKEPVISIPNACLKTSDMEWLILNVQLIFSCCILTANYIISYNDIHTLLVQVSHLILFISALGVLLTCFVFVVLSCALHKSASECHIAICSVNEGSLDDVINIHQDFCDRVLATCKALEPWFVTHWVLFAAVSVITIITYDYVDLSRNRYYSFKLLLYFYMFFLPSLYAARVTRRCHRIITEINNSRSRDWGHTHPFRKRKNLNHFVLYAKEVNCGYRVFNINFGDSLGWLSFIFSIVVYGFKLLHR